MAALAKLLPSSEDRSEAFELARQIAFTSGVSGDAGRAMARTIRWILEL